MVIVTCIISLLLLSPGCVITTALPVDKYHSHINGQRAEKDKHQHGGPVAVIVSDVTARSDVIEAPLKSKNATISLAIWLSEYDKKLGYLAQ